MKPFFVRELVARVLAVQRRQDSSNVAPLQFGALRIDVVAREVTVAAVPVHLTTMEFDLLACMAARPKHVFSRDELLRSVWQSAADWQKESTVTEHIHRLRSKIEADPLHPQMLRTARARATGSTRRRRLQPARALLSQSSEGGHPCHNRAQQSTTEHNSPTTPHPF